MTKRLGLSGWRSYRFLLREIRQYDKDASVAGSVFKVADITVDVADSTWMIDALAMYASAHRKGLVTGQISGNELIVRHSSLEFTVRSSMEFAIVCEILSESIYRIVCPSQPVIIDIGANIGVAACYFAHALGLTVYGYELVPEVATRAQKHIEVNGLSHLVTICPAGLAAKSAEIHVVFDGNLSGATTLFHPTADANLSQIVPCKLLSVDAEVDKVRAEHPDRPLLIKMDCEGAEYEILEQLDASGNLNNVSGILMEYHNISPEKNVAHLEELLSRSGFTVHSRVRRGQEYEMLYAFRTQSVARR